MAKRKPKKSAVKPPGVCFPSCVVELARAFQAGEDCGFALHDALLEAGEPELAAHFQGPCSPGQRCVVIEYLIRPARFQPKDGEGYPSELRFCLDLHLQGAFLVSADYHGEGDSGLLESHRIEGPDGQELDLNEDRFVQAKGYQTTYGPAASFAYLLDQLICLFCPAGYENNEGGHGTFTFNVKEGTGNLEHTWHEYQSLDSDLDPEDEDYETETVNGDSFTEDYDFLNPEVVSQLEPYTHVKQSNVGPGYISFTKRSKQNVPTISVWQGQGKRRRHVEKKVIWAVLTDGRIYDPQGIYRALQAEEVNQ